MDETRSRGEAVEKSIMGDLQSAVLAEISQCEARCTYCAESASDIFYATSKVVLVCFISIRNDMDFS